MTLGLVGRKIGMTRLFTDDGDAVPVTVVDVSNNRVTQIKTPDTDGYAAVQVTFGKRRPSRVTRPMAGHLAKAGVESGTVLREFPVKPVELAELKVGGVIGVDTSQVGDNRVTQVKTPDTDGYAAVQVTSGKRRASRVRKPQAGHLAKAGVDVEIKLQ